MSAAWHVVIAGSSSGPMPLDELVAKLPSVGGAKAMVFGPGLSTWTEAAQVPEVAAKLAVVLPPPPIPKAQDLTFEITGAEQQFITVALKPGERIIAESGALMFMSDGVKMEATTGCQSKDLMDQAFTVGKRMLTGESLMLAQFTNAGSQNAEVAFAAPYSGNIVAQDLKALGGELICQKDSFLCADPSLTIDIAFQKNIGVGLFGGEGFILQRLRGEGLTVVHAGGTLVKKTLKAGETLRLDTGCLVAFTPSVEYDVEMVKDIKSALFGGEGLFLATLKGPGEVWLQSLPFSRFARRVLSGAVGRGKGREDGSILNQVGGPLGSLLRGNLSF